jgi:hypothetical protein
MNTIYATKRILANGKLAQPHRPPRLGDLLPSSLDAQYPRFLFWYNDTCVFLLDEIRVRCRPNRMGWRRRCQWLTYRGCRGSAASDLCYRSTSRSKWVDLILDEWLPRSSADHSMLVYCRFCCLLRHDLCQVTNNLLICIQNSRHYLSIWLIMQQVICLLLLLNFVKCYVWGFKE